MQYGPYDNGHILVGMSNGLFLAYDSIKLTKLSSVRVSTTSPVTSITMEPTQ